MEAAAFARRDLGIRNRGHRRFRTRVVRSACRAADDVLAANRLRTHFYDSGPELDAGWNWFSASGRTGNRRRLSSRI